MLKNYLGGLKDFVLGMIKEWVVTRIITSAVTKILSMFNPVTGLLTIIKTIYNIITFLLERGVQFIALFQAVAGSVKELALGNVKKAANNIEQTLARLLPVAISFLASLLGLGGIAGRIKQIIMRISGRVWEGINKGIGWVVKKAKGLLAKVKGGKKTAKGKTAEARHKRILKKLAKRFEKDDGPKKLDDKGWIAYKQKLSNKLEKETNPKLEKGVKLTISIEDAKGFKHIKYRMRIAPNMSEHSADERAEISRYRGCSTTAGACDGALRWYNKTIQPVYRSKLDKKGYHVIFNDRNEQHTYGHITYKETPRKTGRIKERFDPTIKSNIDDWVNKLTTEGKTKEAKILRNAPKTYLNLNKNQTNTEEDTLYFSVDLHDNMLIELEKEGIIGILEERTQEEVDIIRFIGWINHLRDETTGIINKVPFYMHWQEKIVDRLLKEVDNISNQDDFETALNQLQTQLQTRQKEGTVDLK